MTADMEQLHPGAARWHAKRNAGLSPVRKDGSMTDPETDRQSEAAERFAAIRVGCTPNQEIYSTHGDNGHDFIVNGYSVEVIWLGFQEGTQPRYTGNLIVNPHEPHRHADVYLVVAGSIARGFSLVGWAKHEDLKYGADFGYGPRLSTPTKELRPLRNLDHKL